MYYPFLRGRQSELFALSTLASEIASKAITPIIEPVIFSSLNQYGNYANSKAPIILVVNPRNAEDGVDSDSIQTRIIDKYFNGYRKLSIGIIITPAITIAEINDLLSAYSDTHKITLIHIGEFKNPAALLTAIGKHGKAVNRNVFDESKTTPTYRANFVARGILQVLLRDGFQRAVRNADYPINEYLFSDLHHTYQGMSFDGFGDYTITGNDTRTGGGAANAVTIHFTFKKGNAVLIKHFISDRVTGNTDPGGKFGEANRKLDTFLTSAPIQRYGHGAAGFKDCFDRSHYPGLPYSKRLSIIRHIEVYIQIV